LALAVAALVGRGRQAGSSPHLLAIAELAPAEELVDIDPGSAGPDRAQAEQLPHLVEARTGPVRDGALPLGLQLQALGGQEALVVPFRLQASAQRVRHGGPVPEAQRVQSSLEVRLLRQADPLVREQALDPIRDTGAFLLQRAEFAMELAPILLL